MLKKNVVHVYIICHKYLNNILLVFRVQNRKNTQAEPNFIAIDRTKNLVLFCGSEY